jgi:tRNA modification GTPase
MSAAVQLEGDTIVAPITAPGHAAVSIVRISGPETKQVIQRLCKKAEDIWNEPNKLFYSDIIDILSKNQAVLEKGFVCCFKSPLSFTGEDVCEFNIHGSPFLVERLMENLIECGCRLAEPGEFSKRAFLNGKLDLSQAEAISDIICSETEAQARVAREQLSGKLSQAILNLGEPLRDVLSEIEACIDFPEEDIEPKKVREWFDILSRIQADVIVLLDSFKEGRLYREGVNISIVGLPNAGKSSLLNRLVGEDRAIVTPYAGTTRDVIEESISLGGLCLRFWDTAGLEAEFVSSHKPDDIERLGIERSWKRIGLADLVFYITDATLDFSLERELFTNVKNKSRSLLLIVNKLDLLDNNNQQALIGQIEDALDIKPLYVSALTGDGIDALKGKVLEKLLGQGVKQAAGQGKTVLVTNQRHYQALRNANEAIFHSLNAIKNNTPAECISIDLRSALNALNDIIGVTYTDDILSRIFSKFCIGK